LRLQLFLWGYLEGLNVNWQGKIWYGRNVELRSRILSV
jgi:hypothetical protein